MDSNKTNSPIAPFSCRYSPQIPELLGQLRCTIAITTYQAGKLIFLSPKDENQLIQLPRTFQKPMGIAHHPTKDKLALACKNKIIILQNSPDLAKHYPKAPNTYDGMYFPRLSYFTGPLDIHDLYFGKDEKLYAVNTLFSCIMTVDDDYNFTPVWKPPFIDKFASEDRCHLNGLALKDGKPKYVSAFNQGNTPQSWREVVTTDGIIMDMDSNEVVAENLPMPHTPRIFNNDLYVLLSATGELVKINLNTGKYDVITRIEGFVRGMSLYKDYLFIGLSKLRQNSSTFAKLNIAQKANHSGIVVVHLPTGSQVGEIRYLSSVDEIYDVHILPDKIRPNILNTMTPAHFTGLSIPEATYWARELPGKK